jgi:hypothetical protein
MASPVCRDLFLLFDRCKVKVNANLLRPPLVFKHLEQPKKADASSVDEQIGSRVGLSVNCWVR